MDIDLLRDAVALLDRANSVLDPRELTGAGRKEALGLYARVEKMGAFGVTTLARELKDPETVARTAGTSMGKARKIVATGETLAKSGELAGALGAGDISLDQATAIAVTVDSVPGSAAELIELAQTESFRVLKDKARAVKLEAEQHRDLFQRQREARSARTWTDDLGMGHIELCLMPKDFAAITARGEAEAARLLRADKRAKRSEGAEAEPFHRYLADAYAAMLTAPGTAKGRSKRPDTVLLITEAVPATGWKRVDPGEICKIPGVGPMSPKEAREMARDSVINVVLTDGIDLTHFKRWSRNIPAELQVLLEIGEPPDFDGVKCVDCGNRFRTEFDHVKPHVARGPMSNGNIKPRCYPCHQTKTDRDRKAGKLRAPPDTG